LFRARDFHPHFDFSAAEDPGVAPADSTLGWKRFSTSPVAVHNVPGNHLTMLAMPNIEALALALRDRLKVVSKKDGSRIVRGPEWIDVPLLDTGT
jgi:hypothetical protein